ncbi:hypothetical protein PTKIN_Ptkin16aG0117500 [Pterospermum kingtungense]
MFVTLSQGSKESKFDDLEEDVAFLESQETDDSQTSNQNFANILGNIFNSFTNLQDQLTFPRVDEKDVIVLSRENFNDFIEKNRYVLVEFYGPWCWHCLALASEYAAAATELKGEVVLAKVDGTQEAELLQMFDIEGFPTLLLFVEGVHKVYEGERTKDGIVTWVKKKTRPDVYNVTTIEEAKSILAAESIVVLGFLDSLVGPLSDEIVAASRFHEDVKFYQTSNPDVGKLFDIEDLEKRPALVLLKKDEKSCCFDGPFTNSAIAEFVSNKKIPLIVTYNSESAMLIYDNPIKKYLWLFATTHDSEKIKPTFLDVAKSFKGKLTFVYVEMDNKDIDKRVLDYFGVSGDSPRVLAYRTDDDNKYLMDGDLTLSNIKSFAKDFLEDKLQSFYKSDPIPEKNDGDVKIVVGKNFDEIVLDESKDVLLEIYAPWCSHCQSLEPIYNRLGKHLRGIDSIVIAKMDGTTNEHPRAKADGFPTLLFFPAGNKSSEPIDVDSDRTVVAFYKFLRENAAIPFKLQKPAASTEDIKQSDSADRNMKDEL